MIKPYPVCSFGIGLYIRQWQCLWVKWFIVPAPTLLGFHYSPEQNDFYASSNNLAWTTAAIIDPSVSTSLLDDHDSHCTKQWL